MEVLLGIVIKDLVPGVIDAIKARHAEVNPGLPPLTDDEALQVLADATSSTLAKDDAWLAAHGRA